jgi:hypothetical protein
MRMCRRLGIGRECSTGMSQKGGKREGEMCGREGLRTGSG